MFTSADEVRRVGGMDPEKLAGLDRWLRASDQRNFAATVIRRAHIVFEVERGNSAKTDARRVASVSKAVCATVLAIASELSQRGETPKKMSFDDPAFQFIPGAEPLSAPAFPPRSPDQPAENARMGEDRRIRCSVKNTRLPANSG